MRKLTQLGFDVGHKIVNDIMSKNISSEKEIETEIRNNIPNYYEDNDSLIAMLSHANTLFLNEMVNGNNDHFDKSRIARNILYKLIDKIK